MPPDSDQAKGVVTKVVRKVVAVNAAIKTSFRFLSIRVESSGQSLSKLRQIKVLVRPRGTRTPSGHLPANLSENPEPECIDYRSAAQPSAIYPKDVEPLE